MSANRIIRQVHHWATLVIALTAGVIAVTGILLVLKKDIEWLQPAVRQASGEGLSDASVRQIFEAAQTYEPTLVWTDLDRIDIRLGDGVAKVVTTDFRELQVDIHDLRVLNDGYRGADLIEHIHVTTLLHPDAKYWLMLPAGAALFVMWATGLYMFVTTEIARARKRGKASRRPSGVAAAKEI